VYQRFGEVDAAGTTYQAVAVTLARSAEAMQAIDGMPPRTRRPALVLAALHDLALAGRAPTLAAAYAAGDAQAAAQAAVETVVERGDGVAARAFGRRVLTGETGRGAVLHPAVAEAARRAGDSSVGLVSLGCSAGFDLHVDRVGVTYDNGGRLGDSTSPVQVTASVVGDRPVPDRAMPAVVARVGVDTAPVDATDPDDVRWLRACVWPGHSDEAARLDDEIALAAADPPTLLRGDLIDRLPDAIALVPDAALPVVTTTWAVSRLSRARRERLLRQLEAVATERPLAWVSVEGVGVAPGVPTLGDRPASGHSIIGVTLLDGRSRSADVVGRCWRRGRMLSWLVGS
jgi:hypothetical protein